MDAPLTLENNSYTGFEGSIRIIVKDAAGKQLLDVISPKYAIGPKDPLHATVPNRVTVAWSFKTDPAVGINGADLFCVPARYDEDELPLKIKWGDVIKVAEMVVQAVAGSPQSGSPK